MNKSVPSSGQNEPKSVVSCFSDVCRILSIVVRSSQGTVAVETF